eukprot:m.20271 g.20271  ORF g.20271 m.20271 type:complete len:229 (+) comp5233_c0_seq1:1273-1959(+)
MMFGRVLGGLVGLSCVAGQQAFCSFVDCVVDPKSKLTHPIGLKRKVLNETFELFGVGTRAVTFLNYYVYSAGVYIPKSEVSAVVAFSNQTPTPSQQHLTNHLQSNHRVCIRLTPYRKAALSHLRDGLGRALDARAFAYAIDHPNEVEQVASDVSSFKKSFPHGQFHIDQELLFVIDGNSFTAYYEGKESFRMNSAFVGFAFLNAYLGEDAVIPEIQENFATHAKTAQN